METMLADIAAPFVADLLSPSPPPRRRTHNRTLTYPTAALSPTLSTRSSTRSSTRQNTPPDSPLLASPGGYGSISQVLLPDVTPSPAFRFDRRQFADVVLDEDRDDDNGGGREEIVDSGVVTLLKLQMASVENLAQERLVRLEVLEAQIQELNDRWTRERAELNGKLTETEERLSTCLREKVEEERERTAYVAALEEQIRYDQTVNEKAVEDAVAKTLKQATVERDGLVKAEKRRSGALRLATSTGTAWSDVRMAAEADLEAVRMGREVMAVLLASLEQWQVSSAV
jgi:hypothetical protein